MASFLRLLRDKRQENGGHSNVNCQDDVGEEPRCLMEEFSCLYSEKLRAIEEESPDSLEPKYQALTELVNDLTEQNYMLLKAVEELEREALYRVEAFNNLAEAAKETIQQDTVRRGSDINKSCELEYKVKELQEALKQNELHLSSCMVEVDRLTKSLCEKKSECDQQKTAVERMCELEKNIHFLEMSVKEKSELVQSLQLENEELKAVSSCADKRLEVQLNILKEELKQKNCMLDKFRSETYSPSELESMENSHLTNILALKDGLIDQLIDGNEDIRLQLMKDSKVSELTSTVKWLQERLVEKESILTKAIEERDGFHKENKQACICLASQNKRIEELSKDIECLKCVINEKELERKNSLSNECYSMNDLQQGNYVSSCEQQRLKKYEERICYLENTLLTLQNTSGDSDPSRVDSLVQRIECLQQEIDKKNCEIVTHKDQEENLKYEISRMKTYMNNIERQWQEKASYLGCEIEKKEALLQTYEKQLEDLNLLLVKDQKNFHKTFMVTKGPYYNIDIDDNSDVNQIKLKLKDVQEALTAEIADKHDEIRRLKDDVKELEEKLLHSDKQTQFKDDIIKELRKEVKVGRAKESLAEMLGLKGTPRAAMKARIDHLTGQLEEMRTHILSLEERLADCNLPAVMSLKSRLNNAEGSLVAMCNKMDYVRRYLENLKGDEELSIKCGLEALLSELQDDVEWNRQTRRNLSLDEGTSVIVISHRSHSLPDNSLHRLLFKAKSDSAVTFNKQRTSHSQHSLESFQECRDYIQVIMELENDFEETRKAVCLLLSGLQNYSRENGDSVLNDLGDILQSFENSKKAIGEIIENIKDAEEPKGNTDVLCYNLHCLKINLLDISESLSNAQMTSSSSETFLMQGAGDADIKKKLTTAINDSLSIIQFLEDLKSTIVKRDKIEEKTTQTVEKNLTDVISLIKPILEEKEKFYEKLAEVQKKQLEFSQTLLNKILEFEKGFSSYHSSAESLRKETKKLFAIILTKEKQIQKQFDEIDNLKMALSSNKYVEEASEEIDSLRKVVSNKDLQLIEKQELIQNLKYLNHSLRRRQLSLSSPSLNCWTDSNENLLDKSHQLEEGILFIKEKFSSISSQLLKSKDKLIKFEAETRHLLEALSTVHKHITASKESASQKPEQLSLLETSFTEAEHKVEELLHALEVFIFEEQPDYKDFGESISNHIETLLDIAEFIKRSFENERVLMKSLRDENKEMKLQLDRLQNRLTIANNQQTETIESQLLVDECETEVYTKDEFIQSLQEDLNRSNTYLEKMQEEYTSLKLEKTEMEERNQKVMEELQAKVCKLQAALQNQAPEAGAIYQLSCIVEQQSHKIHQFERCEEALNHEIFTKNQDLEIYELEIKTLKNKLNAINSVYAKLEKHFENVKILNDELEEKNSANELEITSLKNSLDYIESMYKELHKKYQEACQGINDLQEIRNEKERECEQMKYQLGCQQEEIEKVSHELQIKRDQIKELEVSREISNMGINMQLKELMDLKEKVAYWENLMLLLKKEISDRSEEIAHWQAVSSKQKDNLTMLIENNQALKATNTEFENEKSQLIYELESNKKELSELTAVLVRSEQLIYQLDLEKAALKNNISELQTMVLEKDKFWNENTSRDFVDKNILREQEEFIEVLLLKIAQMNSFLADRDETINLLENQLKTLFTEYYADVGGY